MHATWPTNYYTVIAIDIVVTTLSKLTYTQTFAPKKKNSYRILAAKLNACNEQKELKSAHKNKTQEREKNITHELL